MEQSRALDTRKYPYIVCCFDISSSKSFENCSKWIQSVVTARTDSQVLILANKKYLRDGTARAEVDAEEGERFANSKEYEYFETRAFGALNVKLPFQYMTERCVQRQKELARK